jgi:hypothetical protein
MANTMQTTPTEQSGQGVDKVKDRAANVASTAGEEARAVARDATSHAREVVGETRQQLRRQADDQTQRLTGSLRQVSDQIRGMGEGRAAPSGMVADLTRQLADMTGSVASRLESGGLDSALDDVKRFARNRPALFLAAAAGTGFLVGRLMKAVDTHSVIDAAKQAVNPETGESFGQAPPSSGSAFVTAPPATELGTGTTAAGGSGTYLGSGQ